MSHDLNRLSPAILEFLADRHLATLTTMRSDGSPHVVAVGFTFDAATRIARVITKDGSTKVRNADRVGPNGTGSRAALCQVDGRRWLTLEGVGAISRRPEDITDAELAYAARYRTPRPNPQRVVLTIAVDRILGRA